MKKYFSQLRPLERRLVVGVAVVLLIVLNWAFIWPHFSDWSNYRDRLEDATLKLKNYRAAVAEMPELQKKVKKYESEGEFVALEDQCIDFMRTIQIAVRAERLGNCKTFRRLHDAYQRQFFVEQIAEHQRPGPGGAVGGFPLQARRRRLDDPRARPDAATRPAAPKAGGRHPARGELPEKSDGIRRENRNRKGKMKTILLVLMLALTGLELQAQVANPAPPCRAVRRATA